MTIPLCHHIMPSGNTCGSPALRHQAFCYFHNERRKRALRARRARDLRSRTCPFHPQVRTYRNQCPLFLSASQIPTPDPVNFEPPLIQPGQLVQLKIGN